MKNSILILTLLVLLPGVTVRAQNPTISISQQSACPGTDVAVSINATNLLQIGAITLFIAYDTAAVQYITLNNVHPQLGGLLYNHLIVPQPMVAVSWASSSGASIAAGKLFDIQFHYKNGQGNFTFLPTCEIATTELVILEVTYDNGSIQPSIQILSQPTDQMVYDGEPAGFAVEILPITAYQWQRSTNQGATFVTLGETANFSGADTPTLEIATANLSMNGNLFRCKLSMSGCTIYSRAALLEVQELATQTFQFAAGWNTFAMALQPLSLNVDNIFDDLSDQLIFLSDGQGVYYPTGGVNTLPQIDPSAGYFLKSSDDASIVITGIPIAPTSIPLGTGWNLLPILFSCDIEIGALPDGVLSKIEAICEIAGEEVFWPSKNIQTLTTLRTTKMYRLKANEDFSWEFPACNP
jgi:hypothetical protein